MQIFETWALGSKFTKFLSLLKQQIGFSSNFASLFSVLRHSSSVLFQLKFLYFQQKEPIKVQFWWNFTWSVKSLIFCTLMGFFCQNHIKFHLKKNTEELSVMTQESDAKFKEKLAYGFKYMEFFQFSFNHSKVQKFHFDGLLLSKLYEVWAKKYRGVIFHDTKQWGKVLIKWPCSFKNGMRNWVNFH